MASIPESEKRILLATGRYIGEGFDDSRLDTLFRLYPFHGKALWCNMLDGLHRIHAGKTDVRIYDYVDRNIPMLVKMYQKRLRGYRSMGYEVEKSSNQSLMNPDRGKSNSKMFSIMG